MLNMDIQHFIGMTFQNKLRGENTRKNSNCHILLNISLELLVFTIFLAVLKKE